MSDTDRLFAGSIPALYDRYLGPMIFQPYAELLAARVAAVRPRRVLETAAGTGILTRALAAGLPAGTEIVATDLNQPMVDFAAAQTPGRPILWQQADALSLPFEDQSFDIVACQFGAMFFPDKIAGYREALRVLRPGGTFVFSVWDRIADNEFAEVVTAALAALFPDDPPSFLARTPHGYHDVVEIRGQLAAAGFSRVTAETVARRSPAAAPRDPAVGYCQGTPLRGEIESRGPGRLDEATEAAAAALAKRFGAGPIEAKIQAHVMNAVR